MQLKGSMRLPPNSKIEEIARLYLLVVRDFSHMPEASDVKHHMHGLYDVTGLYSFT